MVREVSVSMKQDLSTKDNLEAAGNTSALDISGGNPEGDTVNSDRSNQRLSSNTAKLAPKSIRLSCAKKKYFAVESEAIQRAKKLSEEHGILIRPYGCLACGGFHMTSSPVVSEQEKP